MTLVTGHIQDASGAPDPSQWFFIAPLRQSSDGEAVITNQRVTKSPVAGVLSVELDPGPVTIEYRGLKYYVDVPDQPSIDVWDLIEASVGVPPTTSAQLLSAAVATYVATHPPYPVVMLADEAAYNALSPKDPATLYVWPEAPVTPTAPDPVSNFDFHEGAGTTAGSLVGSYTITAADETAAGWVTGGARGQFAGAVGPSAGALTTWSVIFEVTPAGTGSGTRNFGHDADNSPWFNFNAEGEPGPWSPEQFGTVAMTVGQVNKVAYVFDGTGSKTYVNGELSGTFGSTYTTDLQSITVKGDPGDVVTLHSVRFWDVALTADQVAAA